MSSVTEIRQFLEIVIDGETDGGLGFVTCKIADYDQDYFTRITAGQTVTIKGQIQALTEIYDSHITTVLTAGGFSKRIISDETNFTQVIKPCEIQDMECPTFTPPTPKVVPTPTP